MGTAWSSCCQPLLAATHGDSSPLPLVWTLCFRCCSQTVFKGVPCGCGLWKGALGVGAAALVHVLQQAVL